MAGIIERPAKKERKYNMLVNNRFAALMEEEEVDHGGCPTMTDLFATNRHVTISNINKAEEMRNNIMASDTMRYSDDDRSIGITQSADTVKRSNSSHIMATQRGT